MNILGKAAEIHIDAELFDKRIREGLPEGGDLEIIIKENATVDRNPAVVLTFSVQLPNGTLARAQATTTLRAFLFTQEFLKAKYGYLLT